MWTQFDELLFIYHPGFPRLQAAIVNRKGLERPGILESGEWCRYTQLAVKPLVLWSCALVLPDRAIPHVTRAAGLFQRIGSSRFTYRPRPCSSTPFLPSPSLGSSCNGGQSTPLSALSTSLTLPQTRCSSALRNVSRTCRATRSAHTPSSPLASALPTLTLARTQIQGTDLRRPVTMAGH